MPVSGSTSAVAGRSTTESNVDELRSFFDRRHPYYDDNLIHWEFLRDTYKGGRRWFEGNLFKYLKEGDVEFAARRKRSYRFNHTKEVVDLVQKYLFKAKVTRNCDDTPQPLQDFWDKSMINGFDIDQLMRQVSVESSVGGRTALVVDSNAPAKYDEDGNQVEMSVAERDEYGSKIYAYTVSVEDILDYAWDEDGDGELLWIKLREWYRDDSHPFESTGLMEARVRLWTKEGWFLFREVAVEASKRGSKQNKVEMISEGFHGLGCVPVRLIDHTVTSNPYDSPALIDDIAYLDRAVANYLSNLDAIIQDQTFSQLAIPAQALNRGEDAYAKVLEMGTKRMFTYDAGDGSTAKPEFLSPDPKQAGVILTVINKIINEIYHTVGLAGERTKEDNSVGIDNSSGVAKAYDFERVNSLLMSKAASCEAAENWLCHMVMKWRGEEIDQEYVSYPTSFDVMRLVDELVTSEALQKVNAPDEIRREQMRGMVDKIFPQLKKDIRKRIMKGIDEWKASDYVQGSKVENKAVAEPKRQGSVTKDTEDKTDK